MKVRVGQMWQGQLGTLGWSSCNKWIGMLVATAEGSKQLQLDRNQRQIYG